MGIRHFVPVFTSDYAMDKLPREMKAVVGVVGLCTKPHYLDIYIVPKHVTTNFDGEVYLLYTRVDTGEDPNPASAGAGKLGTVSFERGQGLA